MIDSVIRFEDAGLMFSHCHERVHHLALQAATERIAVMSLWKILELSSFKHHYFSGGLSPSFCCLFYFFKIRFWATSIPTSIPGQFTSGVMTWCHNVLVEVLTCRLLGDQFSHFFRPKTQGPGQLPAPEASQAGETIVTQGEAEPDLGIRWKPMEFSQRMKVEKCSNWAVISCDIVANYIQNLLTKSDTLPGLYH